jgi:hypothetical protein
MMQSKSFEQNLADLHLITKAWADQVEQINPDFKTVLGFLAGATITTFEQTEFAGTSKAEHLENFISELRSHITGLAD